MRVKKPLNGLDSRALRAQRGADAQRPRRPTLREIRAREILANAQIHHAANAIALLYAAALDRPDRRLLIARARVHDILANPDRYHLVVEDDGVETVTIAVDDRLVTIEKHLPASPILFAPNGARVEVQ